MCLKALPQFESRGSQCLNSPYVGGRLQAGPDLGEKVGQLPRVAVRGGATEAASDSDPNPSLCLSLKRLLLGSQLSQGDFLPLPQLTIHNRPSLSELQLTTALPFPVCFHFPPLLTLCGFLHRVEPALTRIKEDRKRIILPAIDNIKYNSFEVQQYANAAHGYNWGLWCMYIIPPQDWLDKGDESAPIRTPAMIGCSFVVDREYFGEIGLLDPGMEVYGGENIELGMRVWQCGGSMEVLPCSRVAHIERTKKPYNNDIDYYAKRNALRAAEVWMDDFKSHVYMAWNIPMTNPGVDFGDVSERVALRQRLQCRSFKWYLENVYPEMRIYNNTITYGEVRNSKASGYCLDQGAEEDDKAILYPCHGMSSQLVRYSTEGLLQLGPLGSTAFLPDSKCLVDDGKGRTPTLKKCEDTLRPAQRLWDFTQNGPIISRDTGRCLEVEMSKDANFGLRLVVQRCSGQKWMIRNWIKHGRH
ncbi:polypeptide N-acetylgalactosaminyltransferase 9-like [Sphaerodactylus townsendi]|uniref:polypeptide N-acetylgalactosaminyltransferase 9-like n=1 Tax=Sphaerodactylus townsendi TaxID=933632 RepID=UPI0020271062|nr:polypeptide N-acetylgalactosaminyltransferase 9-like [Sphaerodactylus townsendi]